MIDNSVCSKGMRPEANNYVKPPPPKPPELGVRLNLLSEARLLQQQQLETEENSRRVLNGEISHLLNCNGVSGVTSLPIE